MIEFAVEIVMNLRSSVLVFGGQVQRGIGIFLIVSMFRLIFFLIKFSEIVIFALYFWKL